MPSKKVKKRIVTTAAAGLGLVAAGVAIYKQASRSKSGISQAQQPQVPGNSLSTTAKDPWSWSDEADLSDAVNNSTRDTVRRKENSTGQTCNTSEKEESTPSASSINPATQISMDGLYRDQYGHLRSKDNHCPQIPEGYKFGDPNRTGYMRDAYETVLRDYGMNEYM